MKTRVEAHLRRHPTRSMAALKTMIQERKRTAIIGLGLRVCPWIDRILVRYSQVGNPPVFDPAMFPWVADLERSWPSIRHEVDLVLKDRQAVPPARQISQDNSYATIDDNWRTFFLSGYGVRSERNRRRCPQTARLVDRIAGLQSAFFSILGAGVHIPRHQGATKAVLTCHLGVHIPKQRKDCRIEVGGHIYAWREGEAFVFDDMYDHEVWNDTDEERIVLLIHVKRPERFPGSLVRDAMLSAIRNSPYVQDVRRNIERWDREQRARWTR